MEGVLIEFYVREGVRLCGKSRLKEITVVLTCRP
jgi:hypothetical protein